MVDEEGATSKDRNKGEDENEYEAKRKKRLELNRKVCCTAATSYARPGSNRSNRVRQLWGQAAQESRRRKKVRIEELQRSVVFLTREVRARWIEICTRRRTIRRGSLVVALSWSALLECGAAGAERSASEYVESGHHASREPISGSLPAGQRGTQACTLRAAAKPQQGGSERTGGAGA